MKNQYNEFKKSLLFIIGLIIVFGACSPFDKEYECRSRFYVTIINKTEDTLFVSINDSSTSKEYFDKPVIDIYKDTIILNPQKIVDDTIDFEWKQGVPCSYYDTKKNRYRISLTSRNKDNIVDERYIFPFDTANLCAGPKSFRHSLLLWW